MASHPAKSRCRARFISAGRSFRPAASRPDVDGAAPPVAWKSPRGARNAPMASFKLAGLTILILTASACTPPAAPTPMSSQTQPVPGAVRCLPSQPFDDCPLQRAPAQRRPVNP